MARACNLREEERGGFSLKEAGPRELQLGFGKGEHPTEFYTVGSLTQIEDSELRESLHHPPLRLRAGGARRRGLLQGRRVLCTQGRLQDCQASLRETAVRESLRREGRSGEPGDCTRAPSDGGRGKDRCKCQHVAHGTTVVSVSPSFTSLLPSLPKFC